MFTLLLIADTKKKKKKKKIASIGKLTLAIVKNKLVLSMFLSNSSTVIWAGQQVNRFVDK